ncbi:MAG: ferredoxin reductase [Acidimicrobiales bacterium]|nr:ferredoxin reductase [Acidimicrobiales bacterium]
MRTITVVGASLAGLRAAEALRQKGFDGTITVVGAESRLPYDRPPLSKQVLAGEWGVDRVQLRDEERYGELDLDLRLGVRATGLDVAASTVALADGTTVLFDGLVIATGASPRVLPGMPDMPGLFTLRTLDDAIGLSDAVGRPGCRVVVVGAGFIGSEVAATCHRRGATVTVLEALPVPLARVLGGEMGKVCGQLHVDEGVDLRCGVGVAAVEGDERVERVVLSDGRKIDADVVVVGVGVSPATAWLDGSGLALRDGVLCDDRCFAAGSAGRIVAAGDVARWHNPWLGADMRVEHWTNAAEQGDHAAKNLLAGPDAAEPYAPVPFFWSDQYDVKIQYVGHSAPDDEIALVHGSPADRKFVVLYGRDGRLTGALAFSRPRQLMTYRRLLAEGASWETALAQEVG